LHLLIHFLDVPLYLVQTLVDAGQLLTILIPAATLISPLLLGLAHLLSDAFISLQKSTQLIRSNFITGLYYSKITMDLALWLRGHFGVSGVMVCAAVFVPMEN